MMEDQISHNYTIKSLNKRTMYNGRAKIRNTLMYNLFNYIIKCVIKLLNAEYVSYLIILWLLQLWPCLIVY